MWKKIIMVLLIAAALCLPMNVYADDGALPTRDETDLEITEIILDGYTVEDNYVNTTHTISVNISNTGGTPVAGKVLNCTVYDPNGMVEDSAMNFPIPTILGLDNQEIDVISNWDPAMEGTYWINVTINLTSPLGNISVNQSFSINDVYDIKPMLTAPSADISVVCADGTDKTLVCKADITNHGNVPMDQDFSVKLEIIDKSNSSVMFVDTATPPVVNIPIWEDTPTPLSIIFNPWNNHTYGHFDFKLTTMYAGDINTTNDVYVESYWVNYTFWDEIEKGNLAGIVINEDNETLEGVKVQVAFTNITVYTDVNGTFNLTDLPVSGSPYTLNFTLDGYKFLTDNGFNVTNATTTNIPNQTLIKILPGGLNGTVMDDAGVGLIGVTVHLGPGINTTTNGTGYYEFFNLSVGTYSISTSFSGYRSWFGTVTILEDDTLTKDIVLLPDVDVAVSFYPTDGSVVTYDEVIQIYFNSIFDPATVNESTILVTEDGVPLTGYELKTAANESAITVEINKGALNYGMTYKMTVTMGVLNYWGESMLNSNTSVEFSVLGPTVTVDPADGSVDVSTTTTILITCVVDIDKNTTGTSITVKDESGAIIPGNATWNAATPKQVVYTFPNPLAYSTNYTVAIVGLFSQTGVPVQSETATFKTMSPPIVDATLTGVVKDNDGNPISDADVIINGVVVTTDLSGAFTHTGIPVGSHVVTIARDGYENITVTIDFASGDNKDLADSLSTFNWVKISDGDDDDDEKGFFAQYWWIFVIILIVLIIIVVVVVVLMTRKKGEEEEYEEEDTRRGRGRPERRETPAKDSVSSARDEDEYFDGEGSFECPNCGEVVSDDDYDCPNCGAEFEEDAFECPECGAQIEFNATECENCGAVFAEEEEEREDDEDYDDEYEEEPQYEVEVEDEDGVTRFSPNEEFEDEEEDEYYDEDDE